jgi:ornithine cyclodeaminase/alanine dehydrogenase-like protein (mu-crystallin family)
MTRLLSNDEIASLVSISDCLDILERSYLELDAGDAITRPRTDSLVANEDGSTYSLKTVDGVLPSAGVAAVRINSDLLSWPETAAGAKREKLPRAGGRWVGLVLLFSTSTGEPLAIFPDGVLQRMRVAATSMIAMGRLARREARTLALIGSGWQAGSQLEGALTVREFDEIRCFSSTADRREQFAKEMSSSLGRDVIAVASADEAVSQADVILCATSAVQPVVQSSWITPGVHLGVIKLAEMPRAGIAQLDVAVIHSPDSTPRVLPARTVRVREREAPDSLDADTAHGLPNLLDLLSGRIAGRTSDDQSTAFINNSGLGLQFAAVGAHLYERAIATGVGQELPTDWFTETVHP